MNQLAVQDEKSVRVALENSLYPGAKKESIDLVLAYCRAAGLDPMQKPVHIVPMSVKQGNQYVWRDVIMPGIGSYRIQASRSQVHAGTSAPEFGPMIEEELAGVKVTYPEWCKVIVKKVIGSLIAEYASVEYWKENYATAGKDTIAPNAMWKRRARGQLAKCAEAQALRKAFPELGSQPTAEEMEGKIIDGDATTIIDESNLGNAYLLKIEEATTPESLQEIWINALKELREANDVFGKDLVKEAIVKRKEELVNVTNKEPIDESID